MLHFFMTISNQNSIFIDRLFPEEDIFFLLNLSSDNEISNISVCEITIYDMYILLSSFVMCSYVFRKCG